jgi:hypothetical protein
LGSKSNSTGKNPSVFQHRKQQRITLQVTGNGKSALLELMGSFNGATLSARISQTCKEPVLPQIAYTPAGSETDFE